MKEPIISVQRKPVHLRLPLRGDNASSLMKQRLKAAVLKTYPAAQLVLIKEVRRLPISNRKNTIDSDTKSNIIYQFTCSCRCRYAGRTLRQLKVRITEHLPKWLTERRTGNAKSAISKHLQESGHSALEPLYFCILYQARRSQEHKFAEAVKIRRTKPALCIQKQFVVNLLLLWWKNAKNFFCVLIHYSLYLIF